MADTRVKRTVVGSTEPPTAGTKNRFRRTLQGIWCSLMRGETVVVLFKLYPFYLAQWFSLHKCTNPGVTVYAVAYINNAFWGHVAGACIDIQSKYVEGMNEIVIGWALMAILKARARWPNPIRFGFGLSSG